MSYLHREWIIKKSHVSVYDCPTLTTDGPESFHQDINEEKGRFNVENFLKMMPRSLKELQVSLKLLIGDNSNELNVDSIAHETLNRQKNIITEDNCKNLLREVENMIPKKSCNPLENIRLQSKKNSTTNEESSSSSQPSSSKSLVAPKLASTLTTPAMSLVNNRLKKEFPVATKSSKIASKIFLHPNTSPTSTITSESYKNNIKKIIINGKEVKKITPIDFSDLKLPLMQSIKSVAVTVQTDINHNAPEPQNIKNKENNCNQYYENHLKNTLKKLKRKSIDADKWLIEKKKKKKITKKNVKNKNLEL
ncbi:Protein of unknown function, partial [Cotesia congregata]